MKMNRFLIIPVVLALFVKCASFKTGLIQTGGIDEMIQNAILDFSNTTKLYKKGTVFSVSVLEIVDKDPLVVRIGENSMNLLLTKEAKIGSKGGKLPTRFIEKEGKLFFWQDDDYPLTEEALTVYERYNLLQDDEGGIITVPDFAINDAQKAAHYYFCKNDISEYKRVVTNIGVGYYDPPNLDCN